MGIGVQQFIPTSGVSVSVTDKKEDSFWDKIHVLENNFNHGIETHDLKETASALLELDRTIWEAQEDLESVEFVSQARDILRDMIVFMATKLDGSPKNSAECLAPLVEELLALRQQFKGNKQWKEADALRDSLMRADVIIEDTDRGAQWRLKS
jgi:cysteinyl-tRNA synthetase